LAGLQSPWAAIKAEILVRYLGNFGLSVKWTQAGHLKLLIPLAFIAGILVLSARPQLRWQKGHRALLLLAAIYFFILTFFEGMKFDRYLVQTVPIFAAILAVAIHSCVVSPLRFVPRWLVIAGAVLLVGLQLSVVASQVHRNAYRRDYLTAVEFLKSRMSPQALIMGPGELAFQFGFEGQVIDDVRLGYYSRKTRDFVVVGDWYQKWFRTVAVRRPELYRYIERRLREEYVEVFRNNEYIVYSRR